MKEILVIGGTGAQGLPVVKGTCGMAYFCVLRSILI